MRSLAAAPVLVALLFSFPALVEPVAGRASSTQASAAPAATIEDAMSRVAAYIESYADQLAVIIGVEHYAQWLQREDYAAMEDSRMGPATSAGATRAISRQLVAEFALVRTRENWDGFRNIYEVDGKPVADAQDRLQKLFADAPATAVEQSRKIAAEGARYNLGSMQRNFNVPTTALFFLARANQPRFRFKKDKDDEVGGVRVWKVKYEETQKPTIIRTSAGKDMPVKGEAWIDPADGRVLKTHMQIDSEMAIAADMNAAKGAMAANADRDRTSVRRVKTTASITATYALDPRLGLLVPAEMLETYEAPMRSAFTGEDTMTKVNCRASYSGFKRFETSGRVLPPK